MSFNAKFYSATYNSSLSLHKFVIVLLMITSVFGYVISYGKLYAFHLVLAAYWLLVVSAFISIRKQAVKAMAVPIFFFAFLCISLLWTPNIKNGFYFVFYFFCGYTILFSMVNYATDMAKLNLIFKALAIMFLLNFFIGLLETTGYFRLPVSPYYGLDHTRPSGFNSNLNNFGFVFIAVFPFMFFHPRRSIKVLGTLLALWFTIKLESKGFFLGLVTFFGLFFVSRIKYKSTWRWVGLGLVGSIVLVMFLALDSTKINLNNRAFTAFEEIERGISLAKSDNISTQGSTGIRAAMYLLGIQELSNTYGAGVGAAGIGSKLASEINFFGEDEEMLSFHNFFLEMLIDMGVIPFFIVMVAYVKLALANLKAAKKIKDVNLFFYNKASGLALLTIIPASIAPSSIIYVFTFWLVIGFAIATYLVTRRQVGHAN